LPDDDPFAGLDDEQRAARERELEEKLLQVLMRRLCSE
jgi:hypothetical protein